MDVRSLFPSHSTLTLAHSLVMYRERSVAMLPATHTRGACASVASRAYCQIGSAIDFCTPVTRLSDSCATSRENDQVARQTSE